MGRPKRKDLPDLSHLAVPGQLIEVVVTPRASRNAIVPDGNILRIQVTVIPENGKANEAVHSLLATALNTAKANLELKRGATSRTKQFLFVGT